MNFCFLMRSCAVGQPVNSGVNMILGEPVLGGIMAIQPRKRSLAHVPRNGPSQQKSPYTTD